MPVGRLPGVSARTRTAVRRVEAQHLRPNAVANALSRFEWAFKQPGRQLTGPGESAGIEIEGPRRQRLRQATSLIAEAPKASSGMAQAQSSQPQQRTTRHSPSPDLHAPVLDEPHVVVVQRGADQDPRSPALC